MLNKRIPEDKCSIVLDSRNDSFYEPKLIISSSLQMTIVSDYDEFCL